MISYAERDIEGMISGYQTWPWVTPNGEIASCTHRAGEESRIPPLTLTLPKFEYGSCCIPYASAFKTIYLASRSTSERFKILPPTEGTTIIYTGLNSPRSPSASWSRLMLSCQPFERYKKPGLSQSYQHRVPRSSREWKRNMILLLHHSCWYVGKRTWQSLDDKF